MRRLFPVTLNIAPKDTGAAILALPIAAGNVIATPYIINQNQYLVHVVGNRSTNLSIDWLVNTVDPYPLFSWIVGEFFEITGVPGLRSAAFLGAYFAILGIYFISQAILPRGKNLISLTVMVIVGFTLNPLFDSVLNFIGIKGLRTNMFHGVAGQYVVSQPGYVQPSLAGSLLILALGLWLRLLSLDRINTKSSNLKWQLVIASGLTAFSIILHPTYVVATLLATFAAFIVDLFSGKGLVRIRGYLLFAIVSAFLAVVANPSLLQIQSALSSNSSSLSRFAFERIPHHTLISRWSTSDLQYVALILLAACLVGALVNGKWIRKWIISLVAIGAVTSLIVEFSQWTSLALLFPWRVSVFLVPLSATVVTVRLLLVTEEFVRTRPKLYKKLVRVGFAFVVVASLYGLNSTLRETSPAISNPTTALVIQSKPLGIGLVPLDQESIRLNANVPIFVDWKSPPYMGDDLDEWWRRIDLVRSFETNPEIFCTDNWGEKINWAMLSSSSNIPSCMSTWSLIGSNSEYGIFQRSE